MINKKLLIISAAAVIAVGIIIGIVIMFTGSPGDADLPVVLENTFPDATAAAGTEDLTNINLPEVDNPGIPVSDDELAVTPEEEEAIKTIESQQAADIKSVEKSQEEIDADNVKIKKAQEEAAKNPDVVQPVQAKPEETVMVPTEPKRDADGYIYTKEQAVKNFVSHEWVLELANDPDLIAAAKETAKDQGKEWSQEDWEGDIQIMLSNPYSDPHLAGVLDNYRETGNIGDAVTGAYEWLALGGRDAIYAKRSTQ